MLWWRGVGRSPGGSTGETQFWEHLLNNAAWTPDGANILYLTTAVD